MLATVATVATWLVVLLHIAFALGESVGWDTMARRFRIDAEATRALALNQGAYNAGLASVLAWALLTGQAATVTAMLLYVVAMSIVGGLSVRPTIFLFQGVPALLALGLGALS